MRPRRSHAELRAFLHQTTPDQGKCRSVALRPLAAAADNPAPKISRATLRHTPRSEHTCPGVWLWSQHSQTLHWRTEWWPSRQWDCPACAAWLAQRDADHLERKIAGQPTWISRIDASAFDRWYASRRRAAQRAGHELDYQRIEQADGMVVVVSSAGAGAPVDPAELEATLLDAYQHKAAGTQVSASTSWQVKPPKAAGAGGRVTAEAERSERIREGGWLPPSLIGKGHPADVVATCKRLGVYVGPLPSRYEAHEVTAMNSTLVLALGLRRIDGGLLERWRDAA
jgi:hypothetical protein